jgi:hypothetical protein
MSRGEVLNRSLALLAGLCFARSLSCRRHFLRELQRGARIKKKSGLGSIEFYLTFHVSARESKIALSSKNALTQ